MTDNEIIKALEWHLNNENHCDDCPLLTLKNTTTYCVDELLKSALALINRQKAEIENLNVELVGMRGACESYKIHYDNAQAEIERLKIEYDIMRFTTAKRWVKEAKIEAIKEFAERVKQEINFPLAVWRVFDNLVKEMTEESK